jgi:hypothetical protein
VLLKFSNQPSVPLGLAKARALACLEANRGKGVLPAHCVAAVIWPEHRMKSQGAGAAASRILKHLEKEGKARWYGDAAGWGWLVC